uniref:Uncharacterized protein n=1 Tax=Compsopogon caeruleus TaxID=31354 RepID=A0A7S1T514_9RHOD|mmetsp:Transcript_10179/g.20545  ORF Transcript_10179/g.20545 Transcript_10179/m.20545 type:complete len:217 (+) Transcript_10179:118-768(+)
MGKLLKYGGRGVATLRALRLCAIKHGPGRSRERKIHRLETLEMRGTKEQSTIEQDCQLVSPPDQGWLTMHGSRILSSCRQSSPLRIVLVTDTLARERAFDGASCKFLLRRRLLHFQYVGRKTRAYERHELGLSDCLLHYKIDSYSMHRSLDFCRAEWSFLRALRIKYQNVSDPTPGFIIPFLAHGHSKELKGLSTSLVSVDCGNPRIRTLRFGVHV